MKVSLYLSMKASVKAFVSEGVFVSVHKSVCEHLYIYFSVSMSKSVCVSFNESVVSEGVRFFVRESVCE